MESTELRIGNYVNKSLLSGNGRKLNLKISINDLEKLDKGNPIFNYEPIPLTEDILLKCGFEKANYEKNYPLYFNKNKTKYSDAISVSVYSDFCRVKIVDKTVKTLVYLHDFQNIYFALTNEELNINLWY